MSRFNGEFYEDIDTLPTEYDDDDEAYSEENDYDDEAYAEEDDYDDEAYGEEDDYDDEAYGEDDYDDDESAAELNLRGINRLIGRGRGRGRGQARSSFGRRRCRGRRCGYRPSYYQGSMPGYAPSMGHLMTQSGRNVPFQLPPELVRKSQLDTVRHELRKNVGKVLKEISKINTNVGRNVTEIKRVDNLHRSISSKQTRYMGRMNRNMRRLRRNLNQTKQQMQMQSMLSLMMKPELENITLKLPDSSSTVDFKTGQEFEVEKSVTKDDMMPMMLAFSGGFGGSGNQSGMNNPMMLYFMMEAMK